MSEAFLQEAVGLLGPHLRHRSAGFSGRHIRPLHQAAYAPHHATRGEGRGREGVTEVFVRATAQRKSLD